MLDGVRAVIGSHVGLRFTNATDARLTSSVETRARIRGMRIDHYADVLKEDAAERQELLELLTVPETSFFRDNAQYEALKDQIIPAIDGPVVAWSAGCSTGQEAYSLAMTFSELAVPDWWVVASDLSQHAIDRTAAGLYRERELRGLSPARRRRWFDEVKGGWQARPELRGRIRTVRHNLATEPPPVRQGESAVVFCRNVLIYLRPDRIAEFLGRVAQWVAPGGYLFLGMSEVLWEIDKRFDRVRLEGGTFAYRRVDERVKAAVEPATRQLTPAADALRQTLEPSPLPRRAPQPTARKEPAVPTPAKAPPLPDAEVFRLEGESLARSGDHLGAVAAFRKALYLDPDDAVAHLHLGLALEAAGDDDAARRAFRAARAAIDRCDPTVLEARLEGFGVAALKRMLTEKVR